MSEGTADRPLGRSAPITGPRPAGSRMGSFVRVIACVALLWLLIGAQALFLPKCAASPLWREDAQRLQLGLKLFPACLGAVQSLDRHLASDGRLLVLVVYQGSAAAAIEVAASLRTLAKIADHALRVELISAADMDGYTSDRPAAIFIASIGLESRRLRAWSERQHALLFSPFTNAVEEGAVVGVYVADRILPSVSLDQALRAGIGFKPYFLDEAHSVEPVDDTNVRTTFLRNFALFIEWPSSAFESSSAPLRYCVLGNPALSSRLERALSSEKVGGRPMRLVDARGAAQWRRCHVLYIGQSASEPASRVLAAVKGAPVLTVGDTEALARQGGMVSLVRRGGQLHTLINREAATRTGIQISSKLLRLATLVSD